MTIVKTKTRIMDQLLNVGEIKWYSIYFVFIIDTLLLSIFNVNI